MSELASSIDKIETAAERLGLAELARRSGIPHTTLADMRGKGWRPKSIRNFEQLLTVSLKANAEQDAA